MTTTMMAVMLVVVVEAVMGEDGGDDEDKDGNNNVNDIRINSPNLKAQLGVKMDACFVGVVAVTKNTKNHIGKET